MSLRINQTHKGSVSMIKKLNHEIEYENTLNQINKDYEVGNITTERKEALISMATVEESTIRKNEVDDRTKMFNNYNSKVNDNDYYLQCIFQFVDDLYIKCLCSFNDSMIADDKVGFLAMEWKGKGDTKINEA